MNSYIKYSGYKNDRYYTSRNNIDKPIAIFRDSSIIFKKIYGMGIIRDHRMNLPSYADDEGDTCWFKHGIKHNIHGPAIINYGLGEYYIDGIEYTKTEWDNERIKHLPKEGRHEQTEFK